MTCPDANEMAAFIDGGLSQASRAHVALHLDACEDCLELVGAAVGRQPTGGERVAAVRAPPLSKGTAIGRYLILDLVGRGGMGEVYASYDPKLDRRIALKLLDERATSPAAKARFAREAQAIARLSHPNVVAIHDAGEFGDRVFIAMEFVEGDTLAEWLAAPGRSWRQVRAVFADCGAGLAAAHDAGLVHRDFKPQNVMVARDGSVRVMDFGLATDGSKIDLGDATAFDVIGSTQEPTSHTLALTRSGVLLGTPLYMSPEQFLRRPTDARTDQFSFCVSLYEALYGERPFASDSLGSLVEAVVRGQIREPTQKTRAPLFVRKILLRGLSADPSFRFPSMHALLDALRYDPGRRRRIVAIGAAFAAMAVVGAAGVLRAPRRAELVCQGGPRRLAEAWDLEDGPKAAGVPREATRAAFRKTGLAYADHAWERATRIIDRYSRDWLRMYSDACEATHVRGEQSTEALDLRMACLSDRLSRVRALAEVFMGATTTVVDNAVSAATALPSLDRCADVQLLRAVAPPPDDPQARASVDALRRDLAHVKALGDSGQCAGAAPAGRQLVAEAEKLGYRALEGEILVELARWGPECMGPDELIRLCKRAVTDGIASRDLEVTSWAAIILATDEADRMQDTTQARDWVDVATASMQAMRRSSPVLEEWRLTALYTIYLREGKLQEGLTTLQRERELIEKTSGTESPQHAMLLSNMGLAFVKMKRFDEALSHYHQAEVLMTNLAGPNHVVVGIAVLNAAEALIGLHRYADAAAACERAIDIFRRTGSSGFYQGVALTLHGEALLGLDKYTDAATSLGKAVSLLSDNASSYGPEARFALARALWTRPEQHKRALTLASESQAGYQRLGGVRGEAAAVEAWLLSRRHPRRPAVSVTLP